MAPTASAALTTTPSPTVATSVPVPPSASASATPATPATSDAATPPPAPGVWRTFTSADGKVSFDYPGSWSVSTPAGAAGSGDVDVDVSDEAAVVVASLHLGPYGGLGGACQGAVPYTVLDSVGVHPAGTSPRRGLSRRGLRSGPSRKRIASRRPTD